MSSEENIVLEKTDSVVTSVIHKYLERSKVGKEKYGTTLDREDLDKIQWLIHLQEELMDATLYIEKLKKELQNTNSSESKQKEDGCIIT
tara:strand:+ start:405 stop:671 length:267 start_codon:yes stop_codon:yes gene_type:complete